MEEVEEIKDHNDVDQCDKMANKPGKTPLNGLCHLNGKKSTDTANIISKTESSRSQHNGEHGQGDHAALQEKENDISETYKNGQGAILKKGTVCDSPSFLEKARYSQKLKELASRLCSSPDSQLETKKTATINLTDDEPSINQSTDDLKDAKKAKKHENNDQSSEASNDSESKPRENGKVDITDSSENLNEDELLNQSADDNVQMEVGSDNEDELLLISPFDRTDNQDSSKKDNVINIDSSDEPEDVKNVNSDSERCEKTVEIHNDGISVSSSPQCNPVKDSNDASVENKDSESMDCITLDDDDIDDTVTESSDNKSEIKASGTSLEQVSENIGDIKDKEDTMKHNSTAKTTSSTPEIIEQIDISPVKSPEPTKTDNDKNNSNDDDDDDVIFEGESVVKTVDDTKKEIEQSNVDSGSAKNSVDKNETEVTETSSDLKNNHTVMSVTDDDDDLIIEHETKSDDKKNCGQNEKEIVKLELDTKALQPEINDTVEDDDDDAVIIEHEEKSTPPTNSLQDPLINDTAETQSENRKRPADDLEDSSDSKRTKVEQDIPKSESKEELASIELIDSDEEMEISQTETKQVQKSEDIESKPSTKVEGGKMITISAQELEDLVRQKVKAYLASQRDTLYAQLTQKVKDLQTNNDLWKKQIKDLQLKINDVTILQQKHEKRKAHTAALRQITTRSVGVQVDEGRTSSKKSAASSVNSSPKSTAKKVQHVTSPVVTAPPGANGMIRLPIPQSSLAPPVLTTPLPQQTQIISSDLKTPTVKSLLGTTRTQPTISSAASAVVTTTPSPANVQYPPRVVTHTPAVPTSLSLISLPPGSSAPSTKVVSKAGGTSRIIDLTDDEPRMIVTLPQVAVNSSGAVRAIPVLSQGSQLVRANFSNNTSGTFQLVLGPGTAPIRPGTIVTGLPQTLIQGLPTSPAPVTIHNTSSSKPLVTTLLNRAPLPVQTTAPAVQKIMSAPLQPQPPIQPRHPAPFPPIQQQKVNLAKNIPSKPSLKVARVNQDTCMKMDSSTSSSENENFAQIAEEDLNELNENTNSKNTKRVVQHSIALFREFLGENHHFETFSKEELDNALQTFFASVRKKTTGEELKKSSLNTIKYGVRKYLKDLSSMDICDDNSFASSVTTFKSTSMKMDSSTLSSKNKQFAQITEEDLNELNEIYENSNSKNTKRVIQHSITLFREFLGENQHFETFSKEELNNALQTFFASVRKTDGDELKKSSLYSIKYGLCKYLKNSCGIDIHGDSSFASCVSMFKCKLKDLKKKGKASVDHKMEITKEDMIKLGEKDNLAFNLDTPWSLQRKVWFDIMYFLCPGGRDNVKEMSKSMFVMQCDSIGTRYIYRVSDEADTIHNDSLLLDDTKRAGKMYEQPDNPMCPVKAFLKYTSKLHPEMDSLWQRPRDTIEDDATVWYQKVPVGIVLSWTMTMIDNMAAVQSYQLFAYQETNTPPTSTLWKKVGDVKALPLPMACTLTQFQVGNKYHFAVRAIDIYGRVSEYSDPSSLHMVDDKVNEKK